MASEVTDLLDALSSGSVGLEEVAQRFRQRKWPRRRYRPPDSYLEMAAGEIRDPDPYLHGSFDDVIAAYDANKISREQFRVLSEAVAQAQRSEDEEGTARGHDRGEFPALFDDNSPGS